MINNTINNTNGVLFVRQATLPHNYRLSQKRHISAGKMYSITRR